MSADQFDNWPADDDFPYQAFPIQSRFLSDHRYRLRLGHEKAAQGRIVIAGLARSLGEVVHASLRRVEALTTFFQDHHCVVLENDSADDTRKWLDRWAGQSPRRTILGEDRREPPSVSRRCLARAERMAAHREAVRRWIVNDTRFKDWDWVLWLDLDLAGGWSPQGLLHSLGFDYWDMMGANGVIFRPGLRYWHPHFYDVWALRWRGSDEPLRPEKVNPLYFVPGSSPFLVNSCFGGAAVYRRAAFDHSAYSGGDTEHASFHRGLRQAGLSRLFLNPSFVTWYGGRWRDAVPLKKVTRLHDIV